MGSFVSGVCAVNSGMVRRYQPGADGGNPYLLVLILLVFGPSILVFTEGQVTFLILLLLVGCFLAMRNGHDAWAGVMLGFSFSLKPFIALLVVYFLVRRRWRLVVWSVAVFAVCSFLALAVFGIDEISGYRMALSQIDWYSFEWNASLRGFFSRLFGEAGQAGLLNHPRLVNPLVYAGSALATGVFCGQFGRDG